MAERVFIFAKAQVSAFIGGMVDYALMICITEFFGVHYAISIVISGILGAIVNFSINRGWTFRSKGRIYQHSPWLQMIKFLVVVFGSILLKSSGTYLVTSFLHIDYRISRVMIELPVSLLYNYVLQKYWVFKKVTTTPQKAV
jgi:putative flippase GtrA